MGLFHIARALSVNLASSHEQLAEIASAVARANGVEDSVATAFAERLGAGKAREVFDETVAKADAVFAVQQSRGVHAGLLLVAQRLFGDDADSIARALLQQVAGNKTDDAGSRLVVLNQLYNIVASGPSRGDALKVLLQYALDAKLERAIAARAGSVDKWVEGLGWDEQREIYTLVSKAVSAAGNREAHLAVLSKYLASLNGADDGQLKEAKEAAITAATLAIRSPSVHACPDVAELAAVKALQGDGENESLFALLELCSTGKVQEFEEFASKNSDVLAKREIDVDSCRTKVRLSSLTSLAAQSSAVSYEQIREALNVEEDEVECWVVSAISAGLMKAKINQLKRVVTVQSVTRQTFQESQWQEIHDSLAKWKGNVGALLVTLK